MHTNDAQRSSDPAGPVRGTTQHHRPAGLKAVLAAGLLTMLLSGCGLLEVILPNRPVQWLDSAVRLGVYLDMSPLSLPLEDEAEAPKIAAFTGTVDTSGSFTIDTDVVCDFALGAEAEYALDLVGADYLDGFSGSYDASGDGFNDPLDCTYETYALFEWVIEFAVLEPVTMQIVATLFAQVTPPVVGESLHYVLVREKGEATPLWIGESEDDEADEAFDESIGLQPGIYEFAVYARPLLQGTSGIASLTSGWIYDVTFGTE
jgi:hypothetical protein